VRVTLSALFLVLLLSSICTFAQSPNASITGIVLDPTAKAIPSAEIIVINDLTDVKNISSTNGEGIYVVANLPPGSYRIQVSKVGFKAIIKPDIILNVQDALSLNFTLPVGAEAVVVTVEGGAPMIDTQDATVSTVIDRQFAENLPLNGRSFQSLIYLTPGVVVTPTNQGDGGQFSVNGQRAASNYWMVDGGWG
jgi:Carboxypeptidase regulatory-like domain